MMVILNGLAETVVLVDTENLHGPAELAEQ
jgi:hypothetical protein